MSDNNTFRDDPAELARLEEMLANSSKRMPVDRVIDKPIDTSFMESNEISIDEKGVAEDGTLHKDIKTAKRGEVKKIDINSIKINPNQNAIDKEDHIKKALYSNKSDFSGVAVQSGYAFTVLPLVKADAMQLLYTSKPTVDYKQSVYDVVYSKIHSFSIGQKMTKKEWMELTTLEDYESILYAIYCATFPTQGKIQMECDHYDCGHEFEFEINNASMVKISDPKISARLLEVSKVRTVEDMKRYTLIAKTESNMLPDCGIIFTLRTPSLQNHIDVLKSVPMDVLEQNSHSLTDSLYIEKVYVPAGDGQYDVVDNRQEILRIINNLSIDDSSDLRQMILDRVSLNRVTYTIKNVKCPKCGRPIPETPVSIEDLLYVSLRKVPRIKPDDPPDVKKKKVDIIEKKAKTLRSAKQANAYEIIAYLDLFEGKISYSELINMPISVLTDLAEAKRNYDEDKVKATQKRSDELAKIRAREEQKAQAKARSTSRKSTRKR